MAIFFAVRSAFGLEPLEPRLQMARPDPSLSEDVKFRLPLSSDTTTHYYFDRDPTAGDVAWNGTSQSYNGHKGTDFSGGPRGRAVFAMANGVLIAKVDGLPDNDGTATGNGNYVRLNHGNDRAGLPINSVYLHFNAGSVSTKPLGSVVAAGEQIGGVGTSGNSTGLHLHLETQLNRVAFDPYTANGSTETSWWVNQGSGSPWTAVNTPKLQPGDAVQVYDLPFSSLTVRGTIAGTSIGTTANNALGTVLEGPTFGAFNNDYNNSLWVWYRVQWNNGLTGWSAQNWLREASDLVAPTVLSSNFLFETSPHKVSVRFSENVAASLTASDFVLTRLGTGETFTPTLTYDANTQTETLNFGRVLPDGNYRLRIAAGAIADASGNTLAADFTDEFYVLGGDANRDRTVNFADLVILAQNYNKSGQTFSQGNFDYSPAGGVDFGDLIVLSQRYGTTASLTTPELLTAGERKRRQMIAKSR